jgi:hypothetical protein
MLCVCDLSHMGIAVKPEIARPAPQPARSGQTATKTISQWEALGS